MSAPAIQEWLQTGLRHHQAGRWDEAAKWYARVRQVAPGNFDALHLDGTRALQQGRHEEAAKLLSVARQLNPKSATCAMRLGISLFAQLRFAESRSAVEDAIKLDPKVPEAWFHHGQALRRLGDLERAKASFERAIALRSDYAEAYDRLGALISGWKGPLAAEATLKKAVELDPKQASAWCNLGLGWLFQGQISDALGAFAKAIEINPKFDHAHAGRGLALAKCYRPGAAIAAFGQAIELNPNNFEAHSARLMELQYDSRCEAKDLFAEHRRFGEAVEAKECPQGPAAPSPSDPRPNRTLRVGFLSPDLHHHSVAYFLEPLLAHLDKSAFEVFLYHDEAKHDDMSDRLKSLAASWKTTVGIPPEALEGQLRADKLDILIDLAGHTGKNRLPLYARRLAPVQATYLGYPDTTGLSAMDYRLVDAISDPEGADAFCTEKLLRYAPTAWSYLPPAGAQEPAPGPAATSGGAVTFGCFNNIAKLSVATLGLWAKVLAAVPGSRLLIKGRGLSTGILQADLVRRLEEEGIARERIVLLERTKSVQEHLAAYAQVDVALDTTPYHGTTTTCEALWMGVPVVTLAGNRHASRVGASVLRAIGRPDWIAADVDGYVEIARRLAGEAAQAVAPRTALRETMRSSPLMDHPGQAQRFGAALRQMWVETISRRDSVHAVAGTNGPDDSRNPALPVAPGPADRPEAAPQPSGAQASITR